MHWANRCIVRPELSTLLSPSKALTFAGLNTFGDRVLFMDLDDESQAALTALNTVLMDHFRQAGLQLPGNRPDFHPHCTLVNVSRGAARQVRVMQLSCSCDAHYHAHL